MIPNPTDADAAYVRARYKQIIDAMRYCSPSDAAKYDAELAEHIAYIQADPARAIYEAVDHALRQRKDILSCFGPSTTRDQLDSMLLDVLHPFLFIGDALLEEER